MSDPKESMSAWDLEANKVAKSVMFGIVILWFGTAFLGWPLLRDPATRGQFGDIFGAVNALFSGFAFMGLLWSLIMQQRQILIQQEELKLQRAELQEQRKEMASSRGELQRQANAMMALAEATAAQVAVAAAQARIESVKVDAERALPHNRGTQVQELQMIASTLSSLGDRVETRVRDLLKNDE